MKTLSELKNELVNTMTKELNNYIINIKKLDKDEIIDKSFEISTKKEVFKVLNEKDDYDRMELTVLSDYEYPLDSIYESLNSCDTTTEVSLDALVDDFLFNEVINNRQYEIEQLEDNQYRNLIYDVSNVLEELDAYDLCEELRNKFEVSKFCYMEYYDNLAIVKQIFDSKEDINYLYKFITDLINDKEFQSTNINKLSDGTKEKLIKEVLPELKNIVRETIQINKKEKISYER